MDPTPASPKPGNQDAEEACAGPTGYTPSPRLHELTAQMLIPGLFRAGAVAARPERVAAAFLSVMVILFAASMLNHVPFDDSGPGVGEEPMGIGVFGVAYRSAELAVSGVGADLVGADLPRLADRARQLLLETPRLAFTEAPVQTLALIVIAAAAWGLSGVFVARGAGMELGRHIHLGLGRTIGFVRAKGLAAVASLLLAPAIAAALLLVPLVLGLLLAVPGLDVVGGLLYGVGVVASAVSVFLLLIWLAASWLAVPAVACDGADAFDATQRAIGMLLSKPLGILLHGAIASVQGVVLVGLVWIVSDLATDFAALASGLLSERARGVVLGSEAGGTGGIASGLVGVWRITPWFITASYAVSYAHCAGVAVYLNARKIVDGQEPSELWMPGDAAGVVAISAGDQDA